MMAVSPCGIKKGRRSTGLSAYAMDFLVRAGEQGYSVPTNAVQ